MLLKKVHCIGARAVYVKTLSQHPSPSQPPLTLSKYPNSVLTRCQDNATGVCCFQVTISSASHGFVCYSVMSTYIEQILLILHLALQVLYLYNNIGNWWLSLWV